MADATAVTFEDGYEQLKGIVTRLDADDVPVHESCELFAQGKGLEKALRSYLTEQKGKLDAIEAGQNLPEFRIVAPNAPDARSLAAPAAPPVDLSDFGSPVPSQAPPQASPADDDIPF
jgi:exodeoxyribonuclease VII small subunit